MTGPEKRSGSGGGASQRDNWQTARPNWREAKIVRIRSIRCSRATDSQGPQESPDADGLLGGPGADQVRQTRLPGTTRVTSSAAWAGFVQSFVYGLTGLRFDDKGLSEVYRPVPPDSWKSLTLKNVEFRGRHYDIAVSRDKCGQGPAHASLAVKYAALRTAAA